MFIGHFAVGLAGRRLAPSVPLWTWFLSVQLVDLVWPFFLLAGIEHVRIVPGITAFTPLDFYHYPYTHSLVAGIVWALLLALSWRGIHGGRHAALLLGGGVLSHWALDFIVHRPDLPVLPGGPFVGLSLWNSIGATLALELTMFAAALVFYVRGRRRPVSFWLMIAVLLVGYLGAAFGPPPPDVQTLAFSALAVWLFVLWAWFADRDVTPTHPAR